MYIVEIYTSKEVWEIQGIKERRAAAIRLWEDCMMDGYNSRITWQADRKED
jgi:hypothetical protein